MTREEAKSMLSFMQAYAEGKTIQFRAHINDEWRDIKELVLNGFTGEYRIKPESEYRPFRTAKECWEEMHKHPDFGWVKDKEKLSYYPIQEVSDTNYYRNLLNDYTFTDGEPFGIKE